MSSTKPLDELNLSPRISEAIRTSTVKFKTCGDLLTANRSDLINQTRLTLNDIQELRSAVSKFVVKQPPTTLLELHRNAEKPLDAKLSLGCPVLNELLCGGILVGRVTEICGESGAGKTQLCLQLSLTCQLPKEKGGLDAGVVYICTEDAFPNRRFTQLKDTFSRKYFDVMKNNLSDNVFIQHVADVDRLKKCLDEEILALNKCHKIGLVVIDSVAALFRGEYEQDFLRRAEVINWLGCQMRRLCDDCKMTFVCVNQITDVPGSESIPSLGLTWSNLINVRLFLSRGNTNCALSSGQVSTTFSVIRTLEIVFAPNLSKSSCRYVVDGEGVRGLAG